MVSELPPPFRSSSATLNYAIGNNSTSAVEDIAVNTGAMAVTGNNTVNLSFGSDTALAVGNYTLLTAAGGKTGAGQFVFTGNATTEKLSVGAHNYQLSLVDPAGVEYLDVFNAAPTISLTSTPGNTQITSAGTVTPTANSYTGVFNPQGTGNYTNAIIVSGSNGSYKAGAVNNISGGDTISSTTGAQTASVELEGINVPDPTIFLLNLTDSTTNGGNQTEATAAQIGTIIADINTAYGSTVASVVTPTNLPASLALTGTYNLELTFGPSATEPEYLNFNFGGYSDNTGNATTSVFNVEVADVAAVPEPTSLGVIAFGAAGLLARRRRRNSAAF